MHINGVDILILAVVILLARRGWQDGILRQGGYLLGFWGGLLCGTALAPGITLTAGDPLSKGLLIFAISFGSALLGGMIGEMIGNQLSKIIRLIRLHILDSSLGVVAGVAAGLFFSWLIAAMVLPVLPTQSAQDMQQSSVLRFLNGKLPPAPSVIAHIGNVISSDFPQPFAGLEPEPAAPVATPQSSEVNATIAAVEHSVVKVEGVACGKVSIGSGFVVAPNVIATNAHVIAGVKEPTVGDAKGWHTAIPIWFDPDLDLALLRTRNLVDSPLSLIQEEVPRGTGAVVLGYPGGGSLTATSAGVLGKIRAQGRNIYDRGLVTRSIYEMQGEVEPGNSGGPAVLPDGRVIGIIFAKSVSNGGISYALTSPQVWPEIQQTQSRTEAVSTQRCTAE